jgi:serine protease Do
MGFAIPTEVAEPVVSQIMKNGKVEHGVMGVTIEDVSPENAQFFNMKKAEGAVVTQVNPDSPGEKAGLKSGDVITGINGKSITDSGQLQMLVLQNAPGTTIHLEVSRNGKGMTLPVTLGSMNNSGNEVLASDHSGKSHWGLGLADLSPDVRNQIQAPHSVEGAAVENVTPGSPADDAGLQQGDVIVSVNRKPVHNASEAAQALSSVPQGQDALVLVWSNGGETFRVLHPSQG